MLDNSFQINKCLEKIYSRITEFSDDELRIDFESHQGGDIESSLLDIKYSLSQNNEGSYDDSLMLPSLKHESTYANLFSRKMDFIYSDYVYFESNNSREQFQTTTQSVIFFNNCENKEHNVSDNEELEWQKAA
jgi:hypothetical protein